MKTIKVNTSPDYNIFIGRDISYSSALLDELRHLYQNNFTKIIIIVDNNVESYFANITNFITDDLNNSVYDNKIELEFISLEISEKNKTRQTKQDIEDKLFQLGANRYTALVAIGGGVLLDLVGFVAATFARGIPVIYIATTLLSMVDAAVGGKTGVNTSYGKNLIGAFKQPKAVLLDLTTLDSLSDNNYLSAISEVIKIAVILDKDLFSFLQANKDKLLARDKAALLDMVYKSVDLKKDIVEKDEKESNLRQLLNFGHTLGHAIEKHQQYTLAHGYAIALGVWLESELANHIGVLSDDDCSKIKELLESYFSSKVSLNASKISPDDIYQLLAFDKKTRNNQPRYVLPASIGKYHLDQQQCSHVVEKQKVIEVLSSLNTNSLLLKDSGDE